VADALLGAAGLGDVGEFFPDTDPAFKDADSMVLLKTAFDLVKQAGWRVAGLDCVVTCEQPKILPRRQTIRAALADALEMDAGSVMVKGKTNERLGDIGAGNAVEALAVCLLESRADS
jgi:2-C-methyl-D-erythritol 2,4-cyclodiphosphate synthase